MDVSRSTVGHGRGHRRRVRYLDQVRERDQGGVGTVVRERPGGGRRARETWGSRRGEAMLCMRDQREGDLSLCALCEREQRREGVVHVL